MVAVCQGRGAGGADAPEVGLLAEIPPDWQVRLDPPAGALQNMETDQAMAREACATGTVALRIYRWQAPAVSIGRSLAGRGLPAGIGSGGYPVVTRPTGGGAVLHSEGEVTYAWAVGRERIPPQVPLRDWPVRLHEQMRQEMLQRFHLSPGELEISGRDSPGPHTFCFPAPVRGDLLYRGSKAAGSAVRVWRMGILVQGTLQGLPFPFNDLAAVVIQAACRCLAAGGAGKGAPPAGRVVGS